MEKYIYIFKRNSLFIQILVSYIVIGAIILSLFSYSLFVRFSSNSMEDINELSDRMLQQVNQSSDQLLRYVFSYYYDLYRNDPDVLNALNSNNLSLKEIIDVYNKMNKSIITTSLIYSVSIYNPQADLVISSKDSTSSVSL